jgi:Uncharacterized protein conserved in bacteria
MNNTIGLMGARIKQLISLSTKIYDVGSRNPKEIRRAFAFTLRSLPYYPLMNNLIEFFYANSLRRKIFEERPFIVAEATRPFFYYHAPYSTKVAMTIEHFSSLEDFFNHEGLEHIYLANGIVLWRSDYNDQPISIQLLFKSADMKEGLLTLSLNIGEARIYQSVFWIARDISGEKALWIGALQGPRNDPDIVHGLTKYFFGYRPKNLILYAVRAFASSLSLKCIYAVSNLGYYDSNYSNSFIAKYLTKRVPKLKTSLDDFWEQTGGIKCNDPRFYELPVSEYRKSMEEISSQKRNLYRKRFHVLDEISASISQELASYSNNKVNDAKENNKRAGFSS